MRYMLAGRRDTAVAAVGTGRTRRSVEYMCVCVRWRVKGWSVDVVV